jgi:branched-chain amino acid transport system permease protein
MEHIDVSSQVVQYIFTGLTIGSIYALIALGFNIIYNVTEVINFAQGEFVVWGGLLSVFFVQMSGLPLLVGVFLAIVAVGLIGIIIYLLTFRPLKRPTILTMIMVTIAVSIILKGIAMFLWGKDPYALKPFTTSPPINFLGAYILPQTFWVLGTTLALVVLLTRFFHNTLTGTAMRACADNSRAAGLVGISHAFMVIVAFALSASLGAAGGALITPITLMEYDRGAILALKGFGAAIFGGLGNFLGAVVAGLMLGILEAFATGFISSSYKDAIALIVLLAVLFFKPSGILGSSKRLHEN